MKAFVKEERKTMAAQSKAERMASKADRTATLAVNRRRAARRLLGGFAPRKIAEEHDPQVVKILKSEGLMGNRERERCGEYNERIRLV